MKKKNFGIAGTLAVLTARRNGMNRKLFCIARGGAILLLALSLVLAGCSNGTKGDGDPALQGTWVRSEGARKIVFSGNEWIGYDAMNTESIKGTFTVAGNRITFNATHNWNGTAWNSWSVAPYAECTYTVNDTTLTINGPVSFNWAGSPYTKQP
jgi:hypothetical protein